MTTRITENATDEMFILQLKAVVGDPPVLVEGNVWFNNVVNKYRGYINGAMVEFTTTVVV